FNISCAHDHICIIALYLLLPIGNLRSNFVYVLAVVVYVIYLVYITLIVYRTKHFTPTYIFAYGIYTFTLHTLMVVRLKIMEYRLRKKLLSRHQLLLQHHVLQMVMGQEKDMIQTVLPQQIAHSLQEEIRNRIEDQRLGPRHLIPRFVIVLEFLGLTKLYLHSSLFLELHPDVSILMGDMVNYTQLTTTLDVKDLVQILHELFVSFDLAAERNNVLRVKFLGDAYECVSGTYNYSPRHAKNCVELALDMINTIAAMRENRKLNIDMRIGVHSGEVFAGIIGRTKWQYDIWSIDVDIAQRLEQYGKPGYVHVSNKTLVLLNRKYVYELHENPKIKMDVILEKAHITTYLIGPQQTRTINVQTTRGARMSKESLDSRRFSMKHEIRSKTRRGMYDEVEQMPVGRSQFACIFDLSRQSQTRNEDQLFKAYITSFWRLFRNSEHEWSFLKMPDIFIKYSLLMASFTGFMIYINIVIIRYTQFKTIWHMFFMLIGLFVITLVSFYKKIWYNRTNVKTWARPTFILSRWLFRAAELIEEQLIVRCFVAFFSIFIVYIMATFTTVDCNADAFLINVIRSDLENGKKVEKCFYPWQVTHNVVLVLALLFFFDGLSLVFKTGLSALIVTAHLLTVFEYYFAWQRTKTTNLGLNAVFAHTLYVVLFWVLTLIVLQHYTYINKVEYHSILRYEAKLKQAEDITRSIKIIMANILPAHVAQLFLESRDPEELFYESFDKVAVMFASIENFEPDKTGLRVLNEYICYYDDLLNCYVDKYKVEKIKVIGWTYMAACGLDADNYTDFSLGLARRKSSQSAGKFNSVRFGTTTRKSGESLDLGRRVTLEHPQLEKDDECVLVMTQFAADLLRIMHDIELQNVYLETTANNIGQLKIGISHGPVMAGVVGLSRPHYDIWGHAVNMASRMCSSGVLNCIQLTAKSAQVLQLFDVRCSYRGLINVKGIGETPTYLLALNSFLEFQPH
ncbi:CG32301, partial [Drosophila busckii]